ncbi:hypothetical protein [Mycetohabitans sp. B46]|uniref:hypothetical protein n=1 Tax=Mycetohabitans sp. B46 TaxID=2772536 RepID=UPI00307DA37E
MKTAVSRAEESIHAFIKLCANPSNAKALKALQLKDMTNAAHAYLTLTQAAIASLQDEVGISRPSLERHLPMSGLFPTQEIPAADKNLKAQISALRTRKQSLIEAQRLLSELPPTFWKAMAGQAMASADPFRLPFAATPLYMGKNEMIRRAAEEIDQASIQIWTKSFSLSSSTPPGALDGHWQLPSFSLSETSHAEHQPAASAEVPSPYSNIRLPTPLRPKLHMWLADNSACVKELTLALDDIAQSALPQRTNPRPLLGMQRGQANRELSMRRYRNARLGTIRHNALMVTRYWHAYHLGARDDTQMTSNGYGGLSLETWSAGYAALLCAMMDSLWKNPLHPPLLGPASEQQFALRLIEETKVALALLEHVAANRDKKNDKPGQDTEFCTAMLDGIATHTHAVSQKLQAWIAEQQIFSRPGQSARRVSTARSSVGKRDEEAETAMLRQWLQPFKDVYFADRSVQDIEAGIQAVLKTIVYAQDAGSADHDWLENSQLERSKQSAQTSRSKGKKKKARKAKATRMDTATTTPTPAERQRAEFDAFKKQLPDDIPADARKQIDQHREGMEGLIDEIRHAFATITTADTALGSRETTDQYMAQLRLAQQQCTGMTTVARARRQNFEQKEAELESLDLDDEAKQTLRQRLSHLLTVMDTDIRQLEHISNEIDSLFKQAHAIECLLAPSFSAFKALWDAGGITVTGGHNWTKVAKNTVHENAMLEYELSLSPELTNELNQRLDSLTQTPKWVLHLHAPTPDKARVRAGHFKTWQERTDGKPEHRGIVPPDILHALMAQLDKAVQKTGRNEPGRAAQRHAAAQPSSDRARRRPRRAAVSRRG